MESISEGGHWDEELRQGGAAGTQFAEVEVDTETGAVRVIKIVAVQDCGLAINRLTTESQINGGVIMGLGQALLEERFMDPYTGRMLNANLEDYKVPGTFEIPEIKSIVFDTHRKVTGIGEPPCIPTPGAIANAVHNAIGVRIRELPITVDKVLTALAKA
jgi:xanthine dehydrogenase YagR molybdenum-binding subunit